MIAFRVGISVPAALIAGLAFAVLAWLCGLVLGHFFPDSDVTVVACALWLLAGVVSLFLVPKRAV
jgi:hypothetical protein